MQAIERDALLCPRNAIFLSINEKKERKAFMKNWWKKKLEFND